MNKTLIALGIVLSHLMRNISNYLLCIGLFLVIYYIYIEYGFNSALLSVGIISILTSMVNELNKLNSKPQRKY